MSRLPRESEVVVRAIKSKQNISRTEHIRITRRRIEKAERDERVDIGMILTPPKTYMGGFTRPRDLRVLAWSKGGQLEKRKVYESPTPDAYTPHTVYVLEGRYPSKRSRERAPAHEHIVGFCRESDFPKVLQRYNSEHTSKDLLEAMDTAQWPWLPKKRGKRTMWWKDDEERIATLREVYGHDAEVDTVKDHQSEGVHRASNIDPCLIPKTPSQPSFGSQQMRGFHTSARVLHPTSYNADDVIPDFYISNKESRGNQPLPKSGATSSTSSPDATSTDVEVTERKTQDLAGQKVAVKRRKHEGSALMEQLSDSILSDEVAASTRRLKSKIPVEHYDAEGNLVLHPSGFVVPGPGHSSTSDVARAKERERSEDEDRAAQKAAVAERVLESDFDNVHAAMASTRPRSHKVPFEVRELDGTVKHPSGFVPPTPADEFKYSDSASLDRDLSVAVGRQRAREAPVSGAIPKMGRGMHTTALVRASEAYPPFPPLNPRGPPPSEISSAIPIAPIKHTLSLSSDPGSTSEPSAPKATAKKPKSTKVVKTQLSRAELRVLDPLPDPAPIRAQYLPTLSSQPFFRPLLTLTFSTRPLAEVVARLSKALPRGLSYVAAVDADDRKYGPSFSSRVRNMRLARMQGLSVDAAQLLAGARGGLLGARFGPEERGRGVDGEGFGEPVECEKRVVGVGVGNWLGRAGEVKEAFRADGVERVGGVWGEGETFRVYGLDDWGKRIDDVTGEEMAYPEPKATRVSTLKLAEERMGGLEESKRKTPVRIAEAGELVQRKSSLEEADA
ncbi:hypothetical protein PAXINDRAFT_181260 [Paxillus involutus ATCC 200175]|uniref:Uncharacterized protein n=1 Tax=Paxillus involutus ATCC 200175 TaxID=664439 RepID=A0A0C9SW35_PAXIN|nr:hypothetical protein PAXINDRAFT_181260 [Paxillus involutus ATCC 200175]